MKNIITLLLLSFSISLYAQNQNISQGNIFDGEPYLTVNPNNSQHLVVAWMGFLFQNKIVINTKVSFDAGQTWSTKQSIPHAVSNFQSADPSMQFDNNGNLYLCYVDYIQFPTAGGVYVTKSTDGGITWGIAVEAINSAADGNKIPLDRPWMVIDRSGGANDGNVYITTKPAPWIFPPNRAYFVKSTDGGNNWSAWKYIDDTGYLIGNVMAAPMATPTISADGTFHCIYPSYVASQSLYAQYINASSTDAGNTFNYSSALLVSKVDNDTLAKKGYTLIADPSDATHLAFVYPSFQHNDLDVFIIESNDAGSNWTTPTRVNDDPIANNRMQDLIWADFDTDGDLVVSWRDRRNSSDSTYVTSSETWGAVLWKDSINFSTNFQISDMATPWDTVIAENGNDFMCVKLLDDTLNATWGDSRTGKLNIWFQRMALKDGVITSIQNINQEQTISIYPNPASSVLNIYGEGIQRIDIYDINGRIVFETNDFKQGTSIDIQQFETGVYTVRVTAKTGISLEKFIKK